MWLRNLLREREPTAPHQVWVSDITYLRSAAGFVYLFQVSDLYSREVVGWHVGESLDACEFVKALQMAMEQLPTNRWPIHHSDRGSQYCCREHVDVLRARGLYQVERLLMSGWDCRNGGGCLVWSHAD